MGARSPWTSRGEREHGGAPPATWSPQPQAPKPNFFFVWTQVAEQNHFHPDQHVHRRRHTLPPVFATFISVWIRQISKCLLI